MSTAIEILSKLQRRGVSVAVEGDTLCLKPKKALDDALLARVRESKPALMEILRSRLSTCSLQCYEVEAGVWIHCPWAGCTTSETAASAAGREVSVSCRHCEGGRRCNCSTCAAGILAESGECVVSLSPLTRTRLKNLSARRSSDWLKF